MENLLSLAFDNLSSYDAPKIRKGLRQVEGLLAQLCLAPAARPGSSTPTRARRSPRPDESSHHHPSSSSSSSSAPALGMTADAPPSAAKSLSALSDDPAFREFFKLQEGFEWNVCLRLVGALDRLVARSASGSARDGENDGVVLSVLDLMQGLMLLHPPSKALFAREQHMNVGCCCCPRPPCAVVLVGSPFLTALSLSTAPPRPPRARALPRHPVGHAAHPRRRPHRHPGQHARL
jgi:hypothetical protein